MVYVSRCLEYRPLTAILIPAYNVEPFIGSLVGRLKRDGSRVYVVDDGSSDSTARAAGAAGAVVISNAVNKGKGAALREGFSRIIRDGFDCVLVMDGDGQHNPDDAARFFRKIEETDADIVVGNRMSDKARMPFTRILINRLMSFLISKLSGQYIPDTQCGFRLIKRKALGGLEIVSSHYEAESELLLKASRNGCRIASVPITTIYHGSSSGIRPIKDTLRFIAMLIRFIV